MAMLTKEEICKKHYNRQLTPQIFDEMAKHCNYFVTYDGVHYDERFLPKGGADFCVLYSRVKKELEQQANAKKLSAEVELERKVALRTERALDAERKRARKQAAEMLLKEMAE
jgi:hypothetical protein